MNSPVTGEFPAQMASNAESVPIWCRHHGECQHHRLINQDYEKCIFVNGVWLLNAIFTTCRQHIMWEIFCQINVFSQCDVTCANCFKIILCHHIAIRTKIFLKPTFLSSRKFDIEYEMEKDWSKFRPSNVYISWICRHLYAYLIFTISMFIIIFIRNCLNWSPGLK